jgi:hypothetical protein
MKKELRFSAKIDTQEFDRALSKMQQQLKEIYRSSDITQVAAQNTQRLRQIGIDPGRMAVDQPQAKIAEAKERRELDLFIKQQIRDQEKLSKQLQEQKNFLENQLKVARELKKLGEDRAKQEENVVKAKKEISKIESEIQSKEKAKEAALKQRGVPGLSEFGERLYDIAQRRGVSGALRALPTAAGMAYRASPVGFISGVAGGVGAAMGAAGSAIQAGGRLYGEYMGLPAQTTLQSGAAQAVYNRELESALGGRAYEQFFYAEEKRKAKEQAREAVKGARVSQGTGVFGRALIQGGIGAAGGAAVGAGIGTIVPIGVTSAVGGIVGGIAGGAAGFARGFGTEGLGLLGIGPYGKAREASFQRMEAEKYEQLFAAQKELSPLKKLSFQDFQKNFQQDLQLQRSLGLSDKGLQEMYTGVTGEGFTRANTRRMAESILASGGSTLGARQGAGLGLKLERDYDLTNAPQLLGRLTGVSGGAAAAEKMLAGIFTASVKEGLDKSEFRAENRKFTETVAEKIYSLGAADPAAAALIAAREASGITDKTTRGLEAARSASQFMSGIEKQTEGVGAVLEMGTYLKDPGLSRLARTRSGASALAAIEGYSMEQIMAMPSEQKLYLERATGQKFEDIYKTLAQGKDIKTTAGVPELSGVIADLRKGQSANMTDYVGFQAKRGEAEMMLSASYKIDMPTAKAAVSMLEKQPGLSFTEAVEQAKQAKLPPPVGGEKRTGDIVEEQAAAMDKANIVLRDQFTPNIRAAADEAKAFATVLPNLLTEIKKLAAIGATVETQKQVVKQIQENLGASSVQETASKPSESKSN